MSWVQGCPQAKRERKGSPLLTLCSHVADPQLSPLPHGLLLGVEHDRRGIGFSSTLLRSTLYQDHFIAISLERRHYYVFEDSRLSQYHYAECGGSSLSYPLDAMQVALSPIFSVQYVPAYLLFFRTSRPRNVSALAVGKSLDISAPSRNERGTWTARVVSVVIAQGAGMLMLSQASPMVKMAQPFASRSGDQQPINVAIRSFLVAPMQASRRDAPKTRPR